LADLRVRVKKIKGYCPVYKGGDTFFIEEGYKLRSEKSICMHSLASLMPYYVALSKGILPENIGLGTEGVAYVQCLDPCEYTGGGTVILEIRRDGGAK